MPNLIQWSVLLWIAIQFLVFDASAQSSPDAGGEASTVQEPKPSSDGAKPLASEANPGDSLLSLETICVLVQNTGILSHRYSKSNDNEQNLLDQTSPSAPCKGFGSDDGRLIGTGDVIIGVQKTAFDKVQKSKLGLQGEFILFLNGVAFPEDSSLLSSEVVGSLMFLRFRIRQGPETQKLWSILYTDGALFDPQDLYAGLGWRSTASGDLTMIPVRLDTTAEISLTTEPRFGFSILLVLLSVGVLFYIGRRTDVLRDVEDSQIPQWWADAKQLKATIDELKGQVAREARLLALNPNYDPRLNQDYGLLAKLALAGEPVTDTDIEATKIGLALKVGSWKPVRASYSLSRIQMALWFTFAIATGVFLWMLYGDLRSIDGSLLGLLGISTGTAGISWVADRNSDGGRSYSPSRGLFFDLLTGFDERKQLHRYQAVIVNVLLLVVGIYHVVQQLSYPTFDSTWLIFLGISGSAYGLGKQVLEAPK